MNPKLKIGAKVRFLSDVGGGVVAGFQGKDIVLVEDEDGFQIPTRINDVVVVEADNYNMEKSVAPAAPKAQQAKGDATRSRQDTAEPDDDPADRPVTFRPRIEERKGGDALSAYLAFVPIDVKQIGSTTYESYIVNDSNYYMRYAYYIAEGANWSLRATGEVKPNTKLFIEEFGKDQLNMLEKACMQIVAYKREKSFMLKPTVDVQFRIDPVKFYKLHTFRENDFFESPAMIVTLVENDVPARPLVIDAKKLKQEMYATKPKDDQQGPATGTHAQGIVRRYDDAQSRGRRVEPRKADELVVDLHASEILETTAGMNAADILNYQLDVFRKTLEAHKKEVGRKIVFIHGKGEGVLRRAIVNELKYKYKKYSFQDASFLEYGYGATLVTIKSS